MKAKGEVRATPADAPEIELDENFWATAEFVATRPRRKSSVHLRLDPETLEFFWATGRGHLTRMANVLKAYADTQSRQKPRR
ncbi:MAG: BrnA antitoxin family protein [Beijerinckiaceae bacterium]|nr:BrnA antitoxin family protein [Beijerinckiaceae bacterium]